MGKRTIGRPGGNLTLSGARPRTTATRRERMNDERRRRRLFVIFSSGSVHRSFRRAREPLSPERFLSLSLSHCISACCSRACTPARASESRDNSSDTSVNVRRYVTKRISLFLDYARPMARLVWLAAAEQSCFSFRFYETTMSRFIVVFKKD